jgi:hypothetical protein
LLLDYLSNSSVEAPAELRMYLRTINTYLNNFYDLMHYKKR